MILDEICDLLLPAADGRSVAEVRVGLGYTAVQLDNGRCGLAYTFRHETAKGCCAVSAAGTLAGRAARDLALWSRMSDPAARAIGLATLNALTEDPHEATESDLLDALDIRAEDIAGMVGYFGPFVAPLQSRARALHIFEREPESGSGILPESAAGEVLPRCTIVIISATTLLNGTLDGLLPCCRKARETAIAGPSTPNLAAVFRDRGVTLLSGVRVADPGLMFRIVSEGGGTRQLGKAVAKWTIRCADGRSGGPTPG